MNGKLKYVGITERGDASLDFGWVDKVENDEVDGAILITKDITACFADEVLRLHELGKRLVIHATCTGWGSTWLEPGAPAPLVQLEHLAQLVDSGFPRERCVLRLDPVFPTDEGLDCAMEVLRQAQAVSVGDGSNLLSWTDESGASVQTMRIITSVVDEFPWSKQRYEELGHSPVYGEKVFRANRAQLETVVRTFYDTIEQMNLGHQLELQLCCEGVMGDIASELYGDEGVARFVKRGCVSSHDLYAMGLTKRCRPDLATRKRGCLCMLGKTELLEQRVQCERGCVYCCWVDKVQGE